MERRLATGDISLRGALQHWSPVFCAADTPGRLKVLDDGISMNLAPRLIERSRHRADQRGHRHRRVPVRSRPRSSSRRLALTVDGVEGGAQTSSLAAALGRNTPRLSHDECIDACSAPTPICAVLRSASGCAFVSLEVVRTGDADLGELIAKSGRPLVFTSLLLDASAKRRRGFGLTASGRVVPWLRPAPPTLFAVLPFRAAERRRGLSRQPGGRCCGADHVLSARVATAHSLWARASSV